MTRTRKALLSSVSAYGQFGLSTLAALFLIPLTVRCLGVREYGLWLAGAELFGYLALADLGVFSVLPWLIAAADGRRDWVAIRFYVSNGLAMGLLLGALVVTSGLVVWHTVPGLVGLTPEDRQALNGPLSWMLFGTAIAYVLKVYQTLLIGLQDVVFCGWVAIITTSLSIALTAALLLLGFGLYALAVATAVPPVLASVASVFRVYWIAPQVFSELPRPSMAGVAKLLSEGAGGWMGGFGYRLMTAANGLILLSLGHAEWVPVYACTARMPQLAQQLCWLLPDSALVGLSQLHGEGRKDKCRGVVCSVMQIHLVLSGLAACCLLLFNPSFVVWWVGASLYGGDALNGWLVAGLMVGSLAHGATTTVAVVGWRFSIGLLTLVSGGVQVAAALFLVPAFGLAGLGIASACTVSVITFVVGVWLQHRVFGLSPRQFLFRQIVPCAGRLAPMVVVAALVGLHLRVQPFWQAASAAILGGLLGGAFLAPLLADLPLPWRVRRLFTRIYLLPPLKETP
jgi:O-antigen/teichoic acid export membrane protein